MLMAPPGMLTSGWTMSYRPELHTGGCCRLPLCFVLLTLPIFSCFDQTLCWGVVPGVKGIMGGGLLAMVWGQ
ncbi:hypothetical protein BC832DRAFT_569796 [Gaertneriomyces semiglobifer]|nr:hypothetical protein BC832DRAFT_569796 [Gaertneriomyces semiglobifer]